MKTIKHPKIYHKSIILNNGATLPTTWILDNSLKALESDYTNNNSWKIYKNSKLYDSSNLRSFKIKYGFLNLDNGEE